MSSFPNIEPDLIKYLNHVRTTEGLQELDLSELIVIDAALTDEKVTYQQLSKKSSLTTSRIKQRGSALWEWMRTVFPDYKASITKTRLKSVYSELVAIAKHKLSGDNDYSRVALNNAVGLIPATIEGFYGREDELARLHSILRSQRTVNISGMPGLGKRTLVAHYLKSKDFAQKEIGVVWVHQYLVKEIWGILDSLADDKDILIVIEYGDNLRDDLDKLRQYLPKNRQLIIVSLRPLIKKWIFEFHLPCLSLESSKEIIKEFGLSTESTIWVSVINALGCNPAFIRYYLQWFFSRGLNVESIDAEALISRNTVQAGVLRPQLEDLMSSYTRDELQLLRFIAEHEVVDIIQIMKAYPSFGAKLDEFCRAGLISQRLKQDKSVTKTFYSVPAMLKKFILSGES